MPTTQKNTGGGTSSMYDPHSTIRNIKLRYRDAVDLTKQSGPVKKFSKEEIEALNQKLKEK